MSGSISVDGNSSLRRSGNLNMIADEYGSAALNIDGLLSMNKKISMEIGFLNTFNNDKYDDEIIWFPQGIFVIINSNCSHSKDGLNISLQLKDKMCLLNGECGGVIPAATTFHEYEYFDYETGDWAIDKPDMHRIILELVNHFGGEDLTKIIISDIPKEIKQVMKWGDESNALYMGENSKGEIYADVNRQNLLDGGVSEGSIKTYPYGKDVGYIFTSFTYPGELICNSGDTVCSVLDKIKSTLGNFEYFYDIKGNFVFQEVKNYLNTNKATTILEKLNNKLDYMVDYWSDTAYSFDDNVLISAFANNPQYSMIKNDFIVWGEREGVSGEKMPIRYRLTIDNKPVVGNEYTVYIYDDEVEKIKRAKKIVNMGEWSTYDDYAYTTSDNQRNFTFLYDSFDPPQSGPFGGFGSHLFEYKYKYCVSKKEGEETIPTPTDILERIDMLKTAFPNSLNKRFIYMGGDIAGESADKENPKSITSAMCIEYDTKEKTACLYLNSNIMDLGKIINQPDHVRIAYVYSLDIYDFASYSLESKGLQDTAVIYQVGNDYFQFNAETGAYYSVDNNAIKTITTSDWRSELYFQGINSSLYGTASNDYYVDIVNEWPKLYDISFDITSLNETRKHGFWSDTAEGVDLDYFLDFIEASNAEVGKYSVGNIGRRTKVVNDKSVNCIFEPQIPDIVWLEPTNEFDATRYQKIKDQNYKWYQAPKKIWNKLIGGGHFNSAHVLVQDLLYQHTQYNETISVTSLPIYYLEPNTVIEVTDYKSGIIGKYMIKSFSIPFNVSGTMTLSCSKVLEKI